MEISKHCLWCNKEFTAQKTTTKYCSHRCNNQAYKDQQRKEKIEKQKNTSLISRRIPSYNEICSKDFLRVNEVGIYLGLSRQTIYKLIHSGQLPVSKISSRIMLVKRTDIDEMMEKAMVRNIPPEKIKQLPPEYYSISEIKETFKVKDSWVYKIIRENNIPKIVKNGRSYYNKLHIDKFFKRKGDANHKEIREWISISEICTEFSITTSAAYTLVSRHQIPKKKEGLSVLYSKKHILVARGLSEQSFMEYYTVQEAMQKFNISRDGLYGLIKRNNIDKVKEGKYIKISKDELDRIFSPTNTE